MPIYTFEHQNTTISKLDAASFNSLGILERQHLQAALKNNIQAISPNTLIIAEEFCEWDDSNRRIDLLGIDRDANIIVIELKRDTTGAHMELQALRYGAMVSTMTFSQAVDIYQKYLGDSKSAKDELREFLNWEEEREDAERIQQKTSRQLKRHFLNSQDIIKTSDDRELAVCKEWSRYGTNHFIQQIPDELGYIVEIISDNEEFN